MKSISDADRIDALRLIRTETIGPVTFARLIDRYGSPARALEALPTLAQKAGRRSALKPVARAEAEAELARADASGARLILIGEDDYPTLLAAIPAAPPAIYLRDEQIAGPYRLRAMTSAAETHICRLRESGVCDVRIPGTVFAIASNADFVAAAVHPLNQKNITLYYYVVRLMDEPGAGPPRAVRGPYDARAFKAQAEEHGVPAPNLIVVAPTPPTPAPAPPRAG